jgi:hypothetical protein
MSTSAVQPIALHPHNPHYFLFRGEPTLLITSAEHYGAVINLDFDTIAYLDVLAAYKLNYTRIYAGAYVEPEDYFIHDNTLGPRIGRYCLPWARSAQPGWPLGGNLFDLDAWNPDYFARLKDFIACAGARGIVVEICFFNAMYPDTWEKMPLYHANNIQKISQGTCRDFQTLKEARLVAAQEAYVRKITREVNSFDNVILEICDEPGLHGTTPEEYTAWIERILSTIVETERALPLRHLVAQQACGILGGGGDFSAHPDVPVITGQYIQDTDGAQFGGMHLLDTKYALDKPIELNETGYYPIWYEGDREAASRVEAWEFLVGGGSAFNQLNGLFSTFNPSGANTGNETILNALRILKDFLTGFDFIEMRQDPDLIVEIVPAGAFVRGISQPGHQYALYLHHSRLEPVKYIVQPGKYQEQICLRIAPGSYRAEWVNPATGEGIASENFEHSGGPREFLTPLYAIDIALRILKRE